MVSKGHVSYIETLQFLQMSKYSLVTYFSKAIDHWTIVLRFKPKFLITLTSLEIHIL